MITDAGRKIEVVRAVGDAKRTDTEQGGGPAPGRDRRAASARSTSSARRSRPLQKDLESVRGQCAVEESRLQGARVFFASLKN